MLNPMSRAQIVQQLSEISGEYKVTPRYDNQIELIVPLQQNVTVLSACRRLGFAHLSNIACLDWIGENEFEIMYNLWSYIHKVHLTCKVRTDRTKPEVNTVLALWPQAQVYEQEIHEFFGVAFTGNPDLSPLFLHNWRDIPPLRKNFDSEEYSGKAYGFLEKKKRGAK